MTRIQAARLDFAAKRRLQAVAATIVTLAVFAFLATVGTGLFT